MRLRFNWDATDVFLVAVNLTPIFGVLFFGWNLFDIFFVYWAESAIIGFYNILKMIWVGVFKKEIIQLFLAVPFFVLHFGFFMFVHLVAILAFFPPPGTAGINLGNMGPVVAQGMQIIWQTLVFMFISHGVSFVNKFVRNRQYGKVLGIREQMGQPYIRIVLMHLFIFMAGLGVVAFGAPVLALFVLVIIKIGIDLWLHKQEHKNIVPVLPSSIPA